MNKVILIGNLVRDPEVGESSSGKTYCRFSVAVRRDYPDVNGEYQADFFNCTAEQREWVKKLNAAGYKAVFCYGAEEAKKVVLAYFGMVLNAESHTTARSKPILNDNISVDKSIDKSNKTRRNANK